MLRARLFGPLTVEVDGHAVPEIAGLRPRAVLAWLLLHPGQHSRARVASRFWPDVLDTSARASLRNVLWTVRVALDAAGGSAYLETGRDSVGIAAQLPRQVDTDEFERLAGLDDPAELERCFALADAALLTDLADDWVLEARDDYRERAAGVALRLAEGAASRGEPRAAAGWARRALTRVPYRESAHRTLMRYLAQAGEPAEALAAYARCRAVLAAEFGTVPSEQTRALAARLRADARIPQRRSGPAEPGPVATAVADSGHARPAGAGAPRAGSGTPPAGRSGIPLAGRERELDAMVAAWQQARRGQGGVLVLTGGAGLGKSRLAGELAGRAAAEGARYAVGTVFALAGAPPFAPWSEALRELVADVPAPPADAAWPADLARLCRSVEWRWGRPAAAASGDPEQDRAWLFEAVAEALAWCARGRPVLLVLEDVHLADRVTIALLAYVGRQLAQLPALLVVTRRPGTARQDLALALDALDRRGALRDEVTLAPLARPVTEQIVDASSSGLPAQIRARVVAAAEGNPLLAREAARAAAAGQDLSQGLGSWLRAPLARLSAPARLLVDTVAAAGRPLELGEAAELAGAELAGPALAEAEAAGLPGDEPFAGAQGAGLSGAEDAGLSGAEPLAGAVAAAGSEDLLQVRDRRVQFCHTLVRDACYAELDPARQAWLHGRIATMLQARPGRSVAEVARHLLLAGRRDEARGYLLSAAGQARSLGAFDEAVQFLREAVPLATGSPEPAAEIWLALAEIESWRGSRQEHDAAFDRAAELIGQAGDPAALASAYVVRGRCLRTTLCFPRDALAAYERALEVVEDGGLDAPELRALALAGCAWVESASGDAGGGEKLVAAAEALPETAADPGLAAELELARGAALLRSRRFAEAERVSEHANQLGRRAGRGDIADVGLIQAAAAAAARGALSRTLSLADRVLRQRCSIGLRADALSARAYGLSRLGRHDEAYAAAQAEVALLTHLDGSPRRMTAVYDAGSVALAAGRHDEAVAQLSEALASDSNWFPRALARLRLAEARVAAGDPASAEAELARFPYEPVGPADLPEALVAHLERVQALVAAARGERALARDRYGSAAAGWRRLLAAAPQSDPYAASLTGLGRWTLGCVVEPGVELGRTLAERALVLAEDGALDQARADAQEAAALADRLSYQGCRQTLRLVGELTGYPGGGE